MEKHGKTGRIKGKHKKQGESRKNREKHGKTGGNV